MSSTFGTPTQGAVTHDDSTNSTTQHVNGTAASHDAPQEILDPNDPALVSEAIDVNTEGDAYASPAPPPDGKYRAKLKLEGVKDEQGNVHPYLAKTHANGPYFATAISAQIMDSSGKYDGVNVFDSWVGTFLNKDRSTKVSTILSKLKQPNGQPWIPRGVKLNQRDWMELFVKALAGEPEVTIETAWTFSCTACGEEAKEKAKREGGKAKYPKEVEGMNKFPAETDATKRKQGQLFQPEMKCQVNPAHGYSRARVKMVRVLTVEGK